MSRLVGRGVLAAWALLVGATVAAWQLSDHGVANARTVAVLLLAIAFVKVQLVGTWFMEIRDSPIALVAIFHLWLFGVGTTVMALYYLT
jgi:hypothetical protein